MNEEYPGPGAAFCNGSKTGKLNQSIFCLSNLDRFSLELKEDNDLFKWPQTQEIVVKIFESVS